MGCCSGRCTLAFICGMQLVSREISINPVNMEISQRQKCLVFLSADRLFFTLTF